MFDLFIQESAKSYPPMADFCAGAKSAGPLASFDASDAWVEEPYRNGVVLVGDAAATTDPTYGQGLSFALRAARVLRDELTNNSDWETADATTPNSIGRVFMRATRWRDGYAPSFKILHRKLQNCARELCR
jgi:flavin-dependent dehydrogenase